jgi:hypothetical protein
MNLCIVTFLSGGHIAEAQVIQRPASLQATASYRLAKYRFHMPFSPYNGEPKYCSGKIEQ